MPPRFAVGQATLPRFLSEAAASCLVGECADFEVKASLAFGDCRFEAAALAGMNAALSAEFEDGVDSGDDVVLELEVLSASAGPAFDASGPMGAGAVLKVITAAGEGWRSANARCDVTYSLRAYSPVRWRWPTGGDPAAVVALEDLEEDADAAEVAVTSKAVLNPAESCIRGSDAVRSALETMAKGEVCLAACRDSGRVVELRRGTHVFRT